MYEIKIWVEENGNIVAFMRVGGREGYKEMSMEEVRDVVCPLMRY